MPGSGKSGNWRSDCFRVIARRASSAAAEAWGAGCPPWAAWRARVGSGWSRGGWAAVAAAWSGVSRGVAELMGWDECAGLLVEGGGGGEVILKKQQQRRQQQRG